ncbi:TetR/AcrR family transcriptional regulator [Pseudonocardia kujensis]|uniref:TetR/AcrR family transcriptional regulator n=1 Tax=Pseudonocardia kujensis TaxID=1128675 RepID=UPI0027DF6D85|nr:TetR/AcrR family transcriptional regulator [Pseudonocardia kujensis]
MTTGGGGRSSDARARAARTKRDRTRRALLDAADANFGSRGWNRTRMEDIAATAGVSPATAYNHFPSKHALIGHVYAPLVDSLVQQAEQDRRAGRPVLDALRDQVNALTRTSWRHRGLTAAFWYGVQDYLATRVGGPPDPADLGDPRTLAPVPDAILGLLADGQASGELRPYPSALEISGLIVNTLLIRAVNRPHEPPEQTAELLLTVLFGTLKPELLCGALEDERPLARDH